MRYPVNQGPNSELPFGESMHGMLTLSMLLSIVIGVILFAIASYGRVLWMKVWSLGLIICSVGYLFADFTGIF